MRPSAFANGNDGEPANRIGHRIDFNEAVGFRQRKFRNFSYAGRTTADFNEAVGFRQRK